MKKSSCLFLLLLFSIGAQTSQQAQRVTKPRIQPLQPSEWTDIDREILGSRSRNNQANNLFKTCLRNREACRSYLGFLNYVETSPDSTFPRRDRELLILRTTWLCHNEYPWSHHVSGSQKTGLTPDDIARVMRGPQAKGWNPFEAALTQAADELHVAQFITDATWNALAKMYNERQIIDAIYLVGAYTTLGMYMNSAGIQLDPGMTGFSK